MSKNLWIIDDDEDELYLLHKALNRLDATILVSVFSDAEQAVSAWKQAITDNSYPQLICSDWNMLPLDGPDLFLTLESLTPEHQSTNFVLVTGAFPSDMKSRMEGFKQLTKTLLKPDIPRDLALQLISLLP